MSYVQERLAEIARENATKKQVAKRTRPRTVQKSTAPTKGRSGYIYFISSESDRVKIGFAADVTRRLNGLQTASPDALNLVTYFPTYDICEGMIHHRFRHDRIRGEWFNVTDEMEDLWDDIYDYQAFTRRVGLQSTWATLEPEEVAFILDTIGTPWGTLVPEGHPSMKGFSHGPDS